MGTSLLLPWLDVLLTGCDDGDDKSSSSSSSDDVDGDVKDDDDEYDVSSSISILILAASLRHRSLFIFSLGETDQKILVFGQLL